MAKETVMARESGAASQNAVGTTQRGIARAVSRGIAALKRGEDSRIDYDGGSVVLSDRETRDWSRTGEPWIIEGAHTLYAEFPKIDVTLRYTYTSDKEVAGRYGLFNSRKKAMDAMRWEVSRRIKNLTNR